MESVTVLCVTNCAQPATKHQMAKSIEFWVAPTRSGVRMPMIDLFLRHLKWTKRREPKPHGEGQMKRSD